MGNGSSNIGNDIANLFHPNSPGFLPTVIDNGISTLGQSTTNDINSIIGTVGNTAGSVAGTLGGVAGNLAGSLSSSLMMPLMVIGGLGLAFLLLKPK